MVRTRVDEHSASSWAYTVPASGPSTPLRTAPSAVMTPADPLYSGLPAVPPDWPILPVTAEGLVRPLRWDVPLLVDPPLMVMQSDVTLMLGWQTFQIMVHPRTVSVGHRAAVCKPGVAQSYHWDVDDFRLVPLRLPLPWLASCLTFILTSSLLSWWSLFNQAGGLLLRGLSPQLYLCSLMPRLQPLGDEDGLSSRAGRWLHLATPHDLSGVGRDVSLLRPLVSCGKCGHCA